MNHRPIKAIYVAHYSEFLGANRSLFQLVVALRNAGVVEPLVIAPSEGELTMNLSSENIPFTTAYVRGTWYSHTPSVRQNTVAVAKLFIKQILMHRSVRKTARKLRGQGYELIHTNSSATNFGAWLSRAMGLPHVWHFRENLIEHYGARFPFGFRRQMRIYNDLSILILPISNYMKVYFSRFFSNEKMHMVYNGLPRRIDNITVRTSAKGDCLNVCTVGLLHPSKRQHLIIEAVGKVISRGVTNIHLYIIGELNNSPYCKELQQRVADDNLGNVVTFTGYRTDVPQFITKMDVGVIASLHEAFGRVTVEYMQAGLCPLASNSGANPELVTNGVDGFIFNSADDLAHILCDLAQNPEKLMQLKAKALSHSDKFSLESTVANISRTYYSILSD